jgi:hypothetical protein
MNRLAILLFAVAFVVALFPVVCELIKKRKE